MRTQSATTKKAESTAQSVEFAVVNVVPTCRESITAYPPPPIPNLSIDRKALARLFGKNVQVPKRWERNGWIKSAKKENGRIIGYDAVTVASLAARLFSHFKRAEFNREEASQLGLEALMNWVLKIVRAGIKTEDLKPAPVLDLVGLAALAETSEILPAAWSVSDHQLRDHLIAARQQMLLRLRDPEAQRILIQGWRQSGVVASVHNAATKHSIIRRLSAFEATLTLMRQKLHRGFLRFRSETIFPGGRDHFADLSLP